MNLGILTGHLAASQQSYYIITEANKYVKATDSDIIVFYEIPTLPCISPIFSTMQLYEAFSYQNPLIATSLRLAAKFAQFPGTKEKFFYVWDLEWIRSQQKNYQALVSLYRNDNYKLIARSNEHGKLLAQCWNVDIAGIVEDFNIQQFEMVINAERNKSRLS